MASHQDRTPDPTIARTEGFNSTEVARALCLDNGWFGLRMVEALKMAIEFKAPEMPECSLEQVGEWLVKTFWDHRAAKGDFAGSPLAFFQQAKYSHGRRNPVGMTSSRANDPVAYALTQMEDD